MKGTRTTLLLLAALTATALVTPPAQAGNSTCPDCQGDPNAVAGYSQCAGLWQRNPHVLVDPNPNKVFAVVYSGPFTIVGTGFYAGIPATGIVVRCYYQLNDPRPGAVAPVLDVSSSPSTGVGYLPPTHKDFVASPSDSIYICTTVTWTDPDGEARSHTNVDDFTGGCAGPDI